MKTRTIAGIALLASGLSCGPSQVGDDAVGSATEDLASSPVLLASADFAAASKTKGVVQAELAANANARLLPVGDLAYASSYAANYPWSEAAWLKRTFPVMGNHEFNDVAGKGGEEPYALFNGNNAAGDLTFPAITGKNGVKTYDFFYSHALSSNWLLVVVNTSNDFSTQTAADQASRMGAAINAFRAAHGGHGCVLVAMHTARFSTTFSGADDNGPTWVNGVAPIWEAAVSNHVDIVLQAHVHAYEEFVKLDANGKASSSGTKLFTVGAGGRGQVKPSWSNITSTLRVDYRGSPANGVLKLGLNAGGYGYKFESAATSGVPSTTVACNIP